MATSRETARDELATFLSTYLVTTGLIKTVVKNKLGIITAGIFPLCYIRNTGTNRARATLPNDYPVFYFDIVVYVPQYGWTDGEAVDALDSIEAKIAELVATERHDTRLIGFSGRSTVTPVKLKDNKDYYREVIPVFVQLYTI